MRLRPIARRAVALVVAFAAIALVACRPKRETGRLSVVSYPRGELVVDGHGTKKRTPMPGFELRPGRHVVTIRSAEGTSFTPQIANVRANATTHLYFRSRPPAQASDEVCVRGPEAACWERIDALLKSGDEAHARALADAYLEAFPDDDAERARSVVEHGAGSREP